MTGVRKPSMAYRGRSNMAVDGRGDCHDRVMMLGLPLIMREKMTKEREKDYDIRKEKI